MGATIEDFIRSFEERIAVLIGMDDCPDDGLRPKAGKVMVNAESGGLISAAGELYDLVINPGNIACWAFVPFYF
jgi:hypothetical protein